MGAVGVNWKHPEVFKMSDESSLHNKYSLVKGAARRARQLQSGAQPLMATKSMKACRVAQDEIIQGRVTYVVNHEPKDTSALEPEL
jgi:DNA-directed RNA polymerase subunit omega